MSTDLEYRTHYWDDPEARAAFKAFMIEIHGLDFAAWEAAGFWDYAYTPFSYFQGPKVVASVCIYLLEFVIDGTVSHLAQVSGVGTLPAWRRRGLSRQLTDRALTWAAGKHRGVFLFADDDAAEFYAHCGFDPLEEFTEELPVAPLSKQAGAVRLDPGNTEQLERIHAYARRRTPVSQRFGVRNDRLFMFHALYMLSREIYEIRDLNCLVMYRRSGDRLRIYDIVAEEMPPWIEVYPYIADPGDRIVEFHFSTDRLGLTGTSLRPLKGNNPFVRGAFPVERPVFPFTCRA
jgi:GNAT superfamily N-acetyltransferase